MGFFPQIFSFLEVQDTLILGFFGATVQDQVIFKRTILLIPLFRCCQHLPYPTQVICVVVVSTEGRSSAWFCSC